MITPERMAAVDRNAAALGVPQKQLMESSGNAVAAAVKETATPGDQIAVVGGRGNNGGDAFVAARFLPADDVTAYLIGRPETIHTTITRENWDALTAAEYDTHVVTDTRNFRLEDPDFIVDGVLGTGLTGNPREPERTIIERINAAQATVISVDVPSGMNATTGPTDTTVQPDRVVTFHDTKPALADQTDYPVAVADIGIPEAAERFMGPGDLLALTREPESHKGDNGRIYVIGGGPYTGAPALTGIAGLRAGADLVYVAAPERVAREIQGYSPDLIVEPYAGDHLHPDDVPDLHRRAERRDVTVIGPGIGSAPETLDAVREFLEGYRGTAVIDAEALRVVPDVQTDATLVCTPHQGEFKTMGGEPTEAWTGRVDAVAAFAAAIGHVLLVKGRYDVVSDGTETRINRTGNPGMTVGGTGDVLAGVAAAFLVHTDAFPAAGLAAYVNGRAGDLAADHTGYGLVASDLPDHLPAAIWGDA